MESPCKNCLVKDARISYLTGLLDWIKSSINMGQDSTLNDSCSCSLPVRSSTPLQTSTDQDEKIFHLTCSKLDSDEMVLDPKLNKTDLDETAFDPNWNKPSDSAALKEEDPDETMFDPDWSKTCEAARSDSPILGSTSSVLKRKKRISLESSYDRFATRDPVPDNARGKLRKLLPGHRCRECHDFYELCGFNTEDVQKCSRHRYNGPTKPSTPEGFWALGMPSTEELNERRKKFEEK